MQNLREVKRGAASHASNFDMSGAFSNLEFCQVISVDTTKFLVSAYFFSSRMERAEVPFSFAYQNLDKGILFMPEEGSIGIAGWGPRNEPVILSFVSLPGFKDEDGKVVKTATNADSLGLFALEKLMPGEIMLKGSGRGFLKLNRLGDVKLSTNRFHFIELEQQRGLFRVNVENQITDTEVASEFKGVARYYPDGATETLAQKAPGQYYTTSVKRIFDTADNTVDNYSSAIDLARALLDDTDIGATQQADPVIEVTEGNVIDVITGKPELLDGSELCYKAEVLQNGSPKVTIKINKSGKIVLDSSSSIDLNVSSFNVYGTELRELIRQTAGI